MDSTSCTAARTIVTRNFARHSFAVLTGRVRHLTRPLLRISVWLSSTVQTISVAGIMNQASPM